MAHHGLRKTVGLRGALQKLEGFPPHISTIMTEAGRAIDPLFENEEEEENDGD